MISFEIFGVLLSLITTIGIALVGFLAADANRKTAQRFEAIEAKTDLLFSRYDALMQALPDVYVRRVEFQERMNRYEKQLDRVESKIDNLLEHRA